MSLSVETGTGASDSESYNSLAEISAYAVARGLTFAIAGADVAPAEAAARRATTWLDATYAAKYPGYRVNGRSQALEWPRAEAYDGSVVPQLIGSTEIPREIKSAHCEAAIFEKAKPGGLSPAVTMGKVKKAQSIGPISTDYANTASLDDQRPVLTVVGDILRRLLPAAANRFSGRVVR